MTLWLTTVTVVSVAWSTAWKDIISTSSSSSPLTGVGAVSVLRGVPDEQRLLTKIQRNYDNRVRPVYNSSHRVTVKFALTLVQIIDMVSVNRKCFETFYLYSLTLWRRERG